MADANAPVRTKDGASTAEVEAFLAALDHPRKAEIHALRRIILDADPSIAEGIKWNAPSFRTSEWFATFHLREKEGVRIILHLGAKRREDANPRAAIEDPESLLEWLAEDRASVKLRDMNEVDARRIALKSLIRQWIGEIRP